MDKEKIERLENALLAFVEHAAKETAPETEVKVLPEAAQVLVEILKLE